MTKTKPIFSIYIPRSEIKIFWLRIKTSRQGIFHQPSNLAEIWYFEITQIRNVKFPKILRGQMGWGNNNVGINHVFPISLTDLHKKQRSITHNWNIRQMRQIKWQTNFKEAKGPSGKIKRLIWNRADTEKRSKKGTFLLSGLTTSKRGVDNDQTCVQLLEKGWQKAITLWQVENKSQTNT